MKLELKHLAPYLPYGLKLEYTFHVLSDEFKIIGRLSSIDNSEISKPIILKITDAEFRHKTGLLCFINQCKPILRPLSDLTKEIEVNGEKFAPFKWFNFINSDIDFETQIIALSNDIRWLDSTYYGIIEKLFEWHFDIFGLIEKGLAIDINSLPQSSE